MPAPVCAAIAEVGSAAAALELIENPHAELAPFSWDRIVERHGHLAAIRESMLVLEDLPAATRMALVAKLSDTLAQFVVARNWLSAERAERAVGEAMDRSIVVVAARSRDDDMRGLMRHLRITGQLTAGLILRSLLSGNSELFHHALVELTDLPSARVAALLHDGARRQPERAAEARRPAGIHPSRLPRRAGGDPGNRLRRFQRRRFGAAAANGRAGADPLRNRRRRRRSAC